VTAKTTDAASAIRLHKRRAVGALAVLGAERAAAASRSGAVIEGGLSPSTRTFRPRSTNCQGLPRIRICIRRLV
jgi:hypothetical protein